MTTCKQGHPMTGQRCQTCNNLTRQRRQARKFGDGLAPQERLKRVRSGLAHTKNYGFRPTGGGGHP